MIVQETLVVFLCFSSCNVVISNICIDSVRISLVPHSTLWGVKASQAWKLRLIEAKWLTQLTLTGQWQTPLELGSSDSLLHGSLPKATGRVWCGSILNGHKVGLLLVCILCALCLPRLCKSCSVSVFTCLSFSFFPGLFFFLSSS